MSQQQPDKLAMHRETLRFAAEKGISYGDAGARLCAMEQLEDASAMTPHFEALARIRADGVTERSPNFAMAYQEAFSTITRERAVASPTPLARAAQSDGVPAPLAKVRRFVVAPAAAVSRIHPDIAAVVKTLRSSGRQPWGQKQQDAYVAFGNFKPMRINGGYALISAIANLGNNKDPEKKASLIAKLEAAADVILSGQGPEAA